MRENKVKVSETEMLEWVEGTLEEWLPGYTHDRPTQYKIVLLGNGRYRVEPASYSEMDQGDPRTFHVEVKVREEK